MFRSILTMILVAILTAGSAIAQSYPTKPIRIINPFGAGSLVDIIARVIGQKLTESLGQQVIVDTRAGAAGVIGTELGAKATPDGYTLVMSSNNVLYASPSLYSKPPFDPIKDFAPISTVGTASFLLIASNHLPANSVQELVALAKSEPGKRTLGYKSLTPQLGGELFKISAGIDMPGVSYKGVSAALVDLSSGQLDTMLEAVSLSIPQIKAGRVKVLAVTSLERSALLPNVPTIAESGYPGYESVTLVCLLAPAGTPQEIIKKLNSEVVRILRLPDVKEKLLQSGLEVASSTPERLAEIAREETSKWDRVIKAAGIPKMN